MAKLLLVLACIGFAAATIEVDVNFGTTVMVSKTTTTLQVVVNPILDREFCLEGQACFKNPIHDTAFATLAALEAEMVRFVPWFPYPKRGVGELIEPTATATFWNFTYINPQLDDFMAATHLRNHTTVINFSTQPCWLYNAENCSFPANPDQTDFGYVRGNALKDPTANQLANYYGRLLSWLMHGNFTDELGNVHTGGPGYYNMTFWEVFNEAEHGYTQEWYTHDYDVVVSRIREMADTEHRLGFVGIGGADPSWIPYFLNRSNHMIHDIPLDYVSVHYYASCASRTDPSTYAAGFFGGADGFINEVETWIIPQRNLFSPSTKLDFDELGVIMPDDNDNSFNITADLPPIYWNAAGAYYAYLFGKLTMLGVDVLGHSQFAGSPPIPEWGIPLAQYPSVSLIDWRTGYGNARYWVLKLLIEHFAPGDHLVATNVTGLPPPPNGTNPFCGTVQGPSYGSVELMCVETGSTISSIEFADWGTPTGSCGNYHSGSCHDKLATTKYVEDTCLGKSSCQLTPYPTLGDPCYGTVKTFVVQAKCTGARGGTSMPVSGPPVFAQGFSTGGVNKLLVINKQLDATSLAVPGLTNGGTMYLVDPQSVQAAAANGIRSVPVAAVPGGATLNLLPFAVGVVVYN